MSQIFIYHICLLNQIEQLSHRQTQAREAKGQDRHLFSTSSRHATRINPIASLAAICSSTTTP